jgi:hypothetical protein
METNPAAFELQLQPCCAAVDLILRGILDVLVAYERHLSTSDEAVSRGLYGFFLQVKTFHLFWRHSVA